MDCKIVVRLSVSCPYAKAHAVDTPDAALPPPPRLRCSSASRERFRARKLAPWSETTF
eukprot:gene1847-8495_t